MNTRLAGRTDAGVTIAEGIVAITLLAIVLSSLVPLLIGVARRSVRTTMEAHSLGVISQEVGLISTLPWDSLPGRAGCTQVSSLPFPHELCVAVSDSARARRVEVVVRSTLLFFRPDTVMLTRSQGLRPSPFTRP